MGERSALVAVLGALDRAVLAIDDPAARELAHQRVAELIPSYDLPGAPGWYDRLLAATDEQRHELVPPPPATLDDAIGQLSEALANLGAAEPETSRLLPNRLMAVGAVARTFPEHFLPPPRPPEQPDFLPESGSDVNRAAQALTVPGLLEDGPRIGEHGRGNVAHALILLERLADPNQLPHLGAYREFRDSADNRQLLSLELRSQPPPCTTQLVEVGDPGDPTPAVALVTRICVAGIDLKRAEATFLDPSTWTGYESWCAMVPHPQVTRRFLEVVDIDCDPAPPNLPVAVWLDFSSLKQAPDVRSRSYVMSRDQELGTVVTDHLGNPRHANDAVEVDEGSIKATLVDGHMLVETTKRVRFKNTPIDAPSIAMLACAAGYGALAADFVSDLVARAGGVAQEVSCVMAETSPQTGAATTGEPTDGADPIDDAIQLVTRTVDECADAFKRSYTHALRGDYDADELAADMAVAFARSAQAWAAMVNAASSVTAFMAASRPGPAAPQGEDGGG
jgi:hypothetical protein